MIAPAKHRLLNILLADDGSLNAQAAVTLIAGLPHDRDTMVTALRVFTPLDAAEYAGVEASLKKTKNLLKSRHLRVQTETRLGYPTEKIIEYADEHHPDLVVMGAKGAGASLGLLPGSVAMNVVQDGRWPVLVVREPARELKKIVLAVDGSPCSQLACDYMGFFPLPQTAQTEIVHVLPELPAAYLMEPMGAAAPVFSDEQLAALQKQNEDESQALLQSSLGFLSAHGVDAQGLLLRGDPAHTLLAYAREHDVDLIVCGSHGRGLFTSALLGSVSRDLVYHAPCSVLVVRCQSQD